MVYPQTFGKYEFSITTFGCCIMSYHHFLRFPSGFFHIAMENQWKSTMLMPVDHPKSSKPMGQWRPVSVFRDRFQASKSPHVYTRKKSNMAMENPPFTSMNCPLCVYMYIYIYIVYILYILYIYYIPLGKCWVIQYLYHVYQPVPDGDSMNERPRK